MKRGACVAMTMVLTLALAVAANGHDTSATVQVKTRDELQRAVAGARPGTRIAIAPGTYDGGLAFTRLHGTKDEPIILAAADPSQPPVIQGGNTCLRLSDPAYPTPSVPAAAVRLPFGDKHRAVGRPALSLFGERRAGRV